MIFNNKYYKYFRNILRILFILIYCWKIVIVYEMEISKIKTFTTSIFKNYHRRLKYLQWVEASFWQKYNLSKIYFWEPFDKRFRNFRLTKSDIKSMPQKQLFWKHYFENQSPNNCRISCLINLKVKILSNFAMLKFTYEIKNF